MPDSVVTDTLVALWLLAATLEFVIIALVLRARSGRLRRLVRRYLDPGDVESAPILWFPSGARLTGGARRAATR